MCLNPIHKKYYRHGKEQEAEVPCGKCIECVEQFQQSWQYRLAEEAKSWKYVYFCTLTYRDENLPYIDLDCNDDLPSVARLVSQLPPSKELFRRRKQSLGMYLRPKDILAYHERPDFDFKIPVPTKVHPQLHIKAFRQAIYRKFGNRGICKYFLCSEYGTLTYRPHYHAMIFTNIDQIDFLQSFVCPWCCKYGFCDWKLLPKSRMDQLNVSAYVAKYCCKPVLMENPYVTYNFAPKCFRLISKGIGEAYRDSLCARLKFDENNFSHLPSPWNTRLPNGRPSYTGDYCGFNKDFIKWFHSQLVYIDNNEKTGKIFKVRMPRYWRDAAAYPKLTRDRNVFTNTKTTEEISSNARRYSLGTYVSRKTYRPDKDTALSYALDTYILETNTELYMRQLAEIQAQHPSWSYHESLSELVRIEESRQIQREQRSKQRLIKFYSKSLVNGTSF